VRPASARARRAGPALHRPPPRPRGDQSRRPSTGSGRTSAGRPRCAGRPDARHRGPQRPHDRHRQADRRPDLRTQVETLRRNCAEFGVTIFDMGDKRAGHRARHRPEQGLTQPGMTIVCGDSHTSTHGAFGALAFGIGTSEVEHVLATQTLLQPARRPWRVTVDGDLPRRRDRQGHHPRDHRQDRHRRRHGLRHRVPRRSHPRLSMEAA
jgi:hypothetical protein